MRVICISGKAQHGKDTFANFLRDELKRRCQRVLIIHHSDLLKYISAQYFGWNGEKDKYGRYLLQYVGTDVVRAKNPDFWVDHIIGLLSIFHDEWDFVLIPDCRFPNEITKYTELGFLTQHIRVKRNDFDNGLTDEQKQHLSETSLDDVPPDFVVDNDGGLDDLCEYAMLVATRIQEKGE